MDWQAPVLVEPSVALALRDAVRPGDWVADVGCHMGQLSLLMSRLVGPAGHVLALEANPFTAAKAARFLVDNGCANAMVLNRAVAESSGSVLELNLFGDEQGGVADSLFSRQEEPASVVRVVSLSLDDLFTELNAVPAVLKLDIEGAEWRALVGFTRMLSQHRPILILEQTREDFRCIELVIEYGYSVTDLASYRRIRVVDDYGSGQGVRNVICVHPESLKRKPDLHGYVTPQVDPVDLLDNVIMREPASLPMEWIQPGRYLLSVELDCAEDSDVMVGLADPDGEWLARIHGMGSNPSVRSFQLPFHVPQRLAGRVSIELRSIAGPAPAGCTFTLQIVDRPGLPTGIGELTLG